jgi:hypothetical protein
MHARYLLGIFIAFVDRGQPPPLHLLRYFAHAFSEHLDGANLEQALGMRRRRAGNPNAASLDRVEGARDHARFLMEAHPRESDSEIEERMQLEEHNRKRRGGSSRELSIDEIARAVEFARFTLLAEAVARRWLKHYVMASAKGLEGQDLALDVDRQQERLLRKLKRRTKTKNRRRTAIR